MAALIQIDLGSILPIGGRKDPAQVAPREAQMLGNPRQPRDMLVMVSTRKGAFLFWSDADRRSWRRSYHHAG